MRQCDGFALGVHSNELRRLLTHLGSMKRRRKEFCSHVGSPSKNAQESDAQHRKNGSGNFASIGLRLAKGALES